MTFNTKERKIHGQVSLEHTVYVITSLSRYKEL